MISIFLKSYVTFVLFMSSDGLCWVDERVTDIDFQKESSSFNAVDPLPGFDEDSSESMYRLIRINH